MEKGSFLSVAEIRRFLVRVPAPLVDIVLELRNLVAEIAPGATEKILWKGLSYYDADRGGPVKAGICGIGIHGTQVRLSFIHGAFLEDPRGLLQGKRLTKRYIPLDSYELAPWDDLADLIRQSARFDPASLA